LRLFLIKKGFPQIDANHITILWWLKEGKQYRAETSMPCSVVLCGKQSGTTMAALVLGSSCVQSTRGSLIKHRLTDSWLMLINSIGKTHWDFVCNNCYILRNSYTFYWRISAKLFNYLFYLRSNNSFAQNPHNNFALLRNPQAKVNKVIKHCVA